MPSPPPDADHLMWVVQSSQDAIISADLDGRIRSWNPAAERLFGYAAQEVIGQPLSILLPLDVSHDQTTDVESILAGAVPPPYETVRRARDGRLVPVQISTSPVRDAAGTLHGISVVLRAIAARERDGQAERWLSAIVASSDDAIISKDLDGIVTSWNRAAERIFGFTAAEMIGHSIRRIIPADRQGEEDAVLLQVRNGHQVPSFETVRQRRDGSRIDISLTVSPIHDASGAVIGASKVARDISGQRKAAAERERLLDLAQQESSISATLHAVGTIVAATLDRDTIVQAVTDHATRATGAAFGAFFYSSFEQSTGDTLQLYTLSGAPREAFAQFPHPRATQIFGPTLRGEGVLRLADVTADPRYGQSAPYHGMPPGHLRVRSHLAVPVKTRAGDVIGGLFFGHPEVGVFTEIHERLAVGIAAWASVALDNAALYVAAQEANRVKDEFLATFSHELRTPLNAVLGYARMLRDGMIPVEKQARAIESIERNGTSLAEIVEDVLDVARITTGKLRLQVADVDLAPVVQHAVDAFRPAADAKAIRLRLTSDAGETVVSGDADRLQQVFANLLSNAIKFTPRGGEVDVQVRRTTASAEVTVRDTGVGIPPGFLPHAFERFRQADGGIQRRFGGLGIGLSIARQLVELHGGTIEAQSEGVGLGATFLVQLPLIPAVTAGGRPSMHPSRRAGAGRPAPVRLDGTHVIVVDDDGDAQQMLRDMLEAVGAQVTSAASAAEALRALAATEAHVLIVDLGMPNDEAYDLLRRLREHGEARIRQMPAAALTAFARSEDRTRALRSGFERHLAKPVDPHELLAAVAALAGRRVDLRPER
jgi:PAS domain S-box-containing protein